MYPTEESRTVTLEKVQALIQSHYHKTKAGGNMVGQSFSSLVIFSVLTGGFDGVSIKVPVGGGNGGNFFGWRD